MYIRIVPGVGLGTSLLIPVICVVQAATEQLWSSASSYLGMDTAEPPRFIVEFLLYLCLFLSPSLSLSVTCRLFSSASPSISLDPEGDPLCVLLMIDYYALRAGKYQFLLNLYREWEVHACMYVCMYDCMYVCMYVHMCACVCLFACIGYTGPFCMLMNCLTIVMASILACSGHTAPQKPVSAAQLRLLRLPGPVPRLLRWGGGGGGGGGREQVHH